MEIYTDRLVIRPLLADDWPDIKAIRQDFSQSAYACYDAPLGGSDSEIKARVRAFAQSGDFYLVLRADTHAAIGSIDLHNTGHGVDIGYCFLSAHHRKGYAKESITALIGLYTQRGCKRFSAGTALNNTPSVKLLLSLGFRQTGTQQVSFYKDEQGRPIYFDGGIFELLT